MLLVFFLFIVTQAINMPTGSYSKASPAKMTIVSRTNGGRCIGCIVPHSPLTFPLFLKDEEGMWVWPSLIHVHAHYSSINKNRLIKQCHWFISICELNCQMECHFHFYVHGSRCRCRPYVNEAILFDLSDDKDLYEKWS